MRLILRRAASIWLLSAGMVMAGCATQPQSEGVALPGFWFGLVHGFVMLFSLVASLFWHVRVYAYPNAGLWYDFGFVLGAMMFFGGSHAGKVRRNPRRGP